MRSLTFALTLLPLAATAQDLPEIEEITEIAAPLVGDVTPGLAVLVMREGEILHFSGIGVADIETERPVDADTVFDLASVSKQMTALMAARQIEEGLYDPDTPVSEFFPAFADTDEDPALTVGHLIHHTGGLADYLNEYEDLGATTENPEVVEWLGAQDRVAAAGEEFSYSNSGYLLLGSIVAQAGEADSLAELLQNDIWGPLGMTSTTLATPVEDGAMARGYAGTGGEFELSEEPSIVQGDGNVKSTARDLAAYEAALWAGELLDDTDALLVNGTLSDGSPIADGSGEGYGFGWGLGEAEDGRTAEHSGAWYGTSTYYWRNLDTGVAVILLANGEDADLWELAAEIGGMVAE